MLRLERVKERELRFLSQGDQKKAILGMELMAPVSNLLVEEPLKYLDHFSAKGLQAFLHFLHKSDQSKTKISVKGSLPLLSGFHTCTWEEHVSRNNEVEMRRISRKYQSLEESLLDEE